MDERTALLALDPGTRRDIVLRVARELRSGYVFAEVGHALADALEADLERRVEASPTDGAAWLRELDAWLQRHGDDPHLRLRRQPIPRPVEPTAKEELDEAFPDRTLAERNFGFRAVEVLEGNLGRIDLRLFAPPEHAGATASAAFEFVAHTAGLVLDLRSNGGGDSAMVAFIASHVLAGRRQLCSLVDRNEPSPRENWSEQHPRARVDVPLVVLVGPATASAAEALAWDLRRLGRAITIGAPTRGAAHAVRSYRVHACARLVLPYARALDPNGHNWHRIGVPIDVSCDVEDALAYAVQWLRRAS